MRYENVNHQINMLLYPLIWLAVCLGDISLAQRVRRCDFDNYYDGLTGRCTPCSQVVSCPDGYIRRLCRENSDTECVQYSYFNPENQVESSSGKDDDVSTIDRNHINHHGPATMETEDQEYWKALAFALIGLLSVLIVATVVVLFACCKLHRAVAVKQQDDRDIVDTDSDYVVIRTFRNASDPWPGQREPLGRDDAPSLFPLMEPSSDYGGSDIMQDYTMQPHPSSHPSMCFLPKVYNPQRRLLNYDTDDVFESEDSGGSVRWTSLPRQLKTIHERPDHPTNSKDSGSLKNDTA